MQPSSKNCLYIVSIIFVQAVVNHTLADTIQLTTGDWRPYIFENSNANSIEKEMPGSSIEIVDAAFAEMGHQTVYRTLPFARQVEWTKSGRFTALVGIYKADAPDLLFPNEAIGMTENCFYALKDSSWQYTTLDTLSEVKMLLINGYSYGKMDQYIDKKGPHVTTLSGNELKMTERRIQILEQGRAEVFPEDKGVMNHYFKSSSKIANVKEVGCTEKIKIFIGFSPKSGNVADLIQRFDQALHSIRASGKLSNILNKYGMADWK